MPLNAINNIPQANNSPGLSISNDPAILTSIYDDKVNIAVWQRKHQTMLDQYAQEWMSQKPSHTPRLLISLENLTENLENLLPDLEYKHAFQQDLALIVNMFTCLFDVEDVGLRLTPLKKAMCPKFHVDNIPCRLVTTYGGLGTEWLKEENVDRSRLGRGANGLPDHESGILQGDRSIQHLDAQHIALLKGSGWEGNEEHGLVHRSPYLSSTQSRLLLTLDFS